MEKNDVLQDLQIDTLGYYLDRALNVMVKCLNRMFVEHRIDLQHSQYTVLKVLWCKDGLSQSELARILGKDRAAVSRAIDYLEKKGYVDRKFRNSRTNSVFLTEYANSRKDEIENIANLVTEEAMRGMTDHQKELLPDLLTDIYNNLK